MPIEQFGERFGFDRIVGCRFFFRFVLGIRIRKWEIAPLRIHCRIERNAFSIRGPDAAAGARRNIGQLGRFATRLQVHHVNLRSAVAIGFK